MLSHELSGERPLLVRGIQPADGEPDAEPVFVMNYSKWERDFGSDPTILGKSFVLSNSPRTPVGIMPPQFFPENLGTAQIILSSHGWREHKSVNPLNLRYLVRSPGVEPCSCEESTYTFASIKTALPVLNCCTVLPKDKNSIITTVCSAYFESQRIGVLAGTRWMSITDITVNYLKLR